MIDSSFTANLVVGLLAATPALSQPAPPPGIDDTISILRFAVDGQLTPDEREAVRADVVRDNARDPRTTLVNLRNDTRSLAQIRAHAGNPVWLETRRIDIRSSVAAHCSDKGKSSIEPDTFRMIAEHDPVLEFDPARHIPFDTTARLVVTRHTMQAWAENSSWFARLFGLPPLGPNLVERLSADVRTEWPHLTATQQEDLAGLPRNWQMFLQYWNSMAPEKREKFIADNKTSVTADKMPWRVLVYTNHGAAAYLTPAVARAMTGNFLANQTMRSHLDTLGTGLGFNP